MDGNLSQKYRLNEMLAYFSEKVLVGEMKAMERNGYPINDGLVMVLRWVKGGMLPKG